MKKHYLASYLNSKRGVSAVIIMICLIMIIGFVALAIDVGHLYVARNELQNAADAGALAGAMELFTEDYTAINPNANQIAADMAIANVADRTPVEVNDPLSNVGDVQRGHWSLQSQTFTPNPSLVFVSLSGKNWNELDADTNFINAVRVRTRRENTPITSFFARILKRMGFLGVTEAVAYIGPAGSESTAEIDAPIAICAQSVVQNDGSAPDPFDPSAPPPNETPCWELDDDWANCEVSCSSGSMLDSGTDAGQPTSSHNTAAWINFTTEDTGGCDQADASEMKNLVCKGTGDLPAGVDTQIENGEHVGATGGVQASTYKKFKTCWETAVNCWGVEDDQGLCPEDQTQPTDDDGDGVPEWTYKMKLPVVDCPDNNVGGCPEVVGVICVELIWMTPTGNPDPSIDTPYKMTRWDTDSQGGFIQDPTWDVMAGQIEIPFNTFALLENYLKSVQPDPNKPTPLSSYFNGQTFECSTNPAFIANLLADPGPPAQIPAPLSMSDSPLSLAGLFNTAHSAGLAASGYFGGEVPQYLYTKDFLKVPDPGTLAPDLQNICTPEQFYDAYLHRKADAAGMGRWYSFVDNYKLATYDGKPASLEKKTLYYTPECQCGGQGLGTGGLFLGVLAKNPVLVQ